MNRHLAKADNIQGKIDALKLQKAAAHRKFLAGRGYKVGDIIPVQGYSYAGKSVVVDSMSIKDPTKYGSKKHKIVITGRVLKKDNTPGMNSVTFEVDVWKRATDLTEFIPQPFQEMGLSFPHSFTLKTIDAQINAKKPVKLSDMASPEARVAFLETQKSSHAPQNHESELQTAIEEARTVAGRSVLMQEQKEIWEETVQTLEHIVKESIADSLSLFERVAGRKARLKVARPEGKRLQVTLMY